MPLRRPGNGTAFHVQGYGTIGVQVLISLTATVAFESTVDGTNWVATACTSVADTSGAMVTTAIACAVYNLSHGRHGKFRVRVLSFSSGTLTAKGLSLTA